MTLGEKMKEARLAAGLSQRQLCGTAITRNMLSAIEHGTARPSMDTLRYLAGQLGKPVSFFLEEEAQVSSNGRRMDQVRSLWKQEDWEGVLDTLAQFREPDPVYSWERKLLEKLALMNRAEQALRENRVPYARQLLDRAGAVEEEYGLESLAHRELLLRSRLPGESLEELVRILPDQDEELILRARGALEQGDLARAAALLEAAQDQGSGRWNLLRGEVSARRQQWRQAAGYFSVAADTYPREAAKALEICYRELGDYRQAYHWACRLRDCE